MIDRGRDAAESRTSHGSGAQHRARRRGVAVLGAVACAAIIAACDPGATKAVIGTGTSAYAGDGAAATSASMVSPAKIVAAADSSYFVVDVAACVIRKVDPNGVISTIAGTGTCGYSGDGGPATSAKIHPVPDDQYRNPSGALDIGPDGNLYLDDTANQVIRRIDLSTGTITTVLTPADQDDAGDPGWGAWGFAIGSDGTMYVGVGAGIAATKTDGTNVLFEGALSDVIASGGPDGGVYFIDDAGAVSELDLASASWSLASTVAIPEGGAITDMVVDAKAIYVAVDTSTDPSSPSGRVVRGDWESGVPVNVVGNGSVENGSLKTGHAADLPFAPAGIDVTPSGTLLVSSGPNVYRVNDGDSAPGPTTTVAQTTTTVHSG